MKRRILDFMMTVCCMVFSFLALVACDNELDIRQEYPFTVESMPVADEIVNGETVEIRLEIKAEGIQAGRKLFRNCLYAEVFPARRKGQSEDGGRNGTETQ